MREFNIWRVDEDDYFTKGKFLSLNSLVATPSTSKFDVGVDTREALRRHFEEDTYRREVIADAIAVAFALGRILILPKAWCYCDKLWNNLIGCRAPGAERQATLPFVCPFDHIFDPASFFDTDVQLVGMREYNFLQNPRVPEELRSSIARVRVVRGSPERTRTMEESLTALYMNENNGGVNVTQKLDLVRPCGTCVRARENLSLCTRVSVCPSDAMHPNNCFASTCTQVDWDMEITAGVDSTRLRQELSALDEYRIIEISDARGLLCDFAQIEERSRLDQYLTTKLRFRAFYCSTVRPFAAT